MLKVVSAGFLQCKVTIILSVINKYLGKDSVEYASVMSLLKLSSIKFNVHQWILATTTIITVVCGY